MQKALAILHTLFTIKKLLSSLASYIFPSLIAKIFAFPIIQVLNIFPQLLTSETFSPFSFNIFGSVTIWVFYLPNNILVSLDDNFIIPLGGSFSFLLNGNIFVLWSSNINLARLFFVLIKVIFNDKILIKSLFVILASGIIDFLDEEGFIDLEKTIAYFMGQYT